MESSSSAVGMPASMPLRPCGMQVCQSQLWTVLANMITSLVLPQLLAARAPLKMHQARFNHLWRAFALER